MAVSVKMSTKNQIVVPKMAREALELVAGDRLIVTVDGSTIRMQKQAPDLEDRLAGALADLSAKESLWPELADG